MARVFVRSMMLDSDAAFDSKPLEKLLLSIGSTSAVLNFDEITPVLKLASRLNKPKFEIARIEHDVHDLLFLGLAELQERHLSEMRECLHTYRTSSLLNPDKPDTYTHVDEHWATVRMICDLMDIVYQANKVRSHITFSVIQAPAA